jgi:hypothetical protein
MQHEKRGRDMLSKFLSKALEENTLRTLACKLAEKKTFGMDSAALKMIINCLVP